MSRDNIALVRRWFEEVWNRRRAETIDELLTGESVCHADEGPIRGPEEFKARQHAPFLAAFPDLRRIAEDCPRGCRHDDAAPECALDAAVANGDLSPTRLESFRRMLGSGQ